MACLFHCCSPDRVMAAAYDITAAELVGVMVMAGLFSGSIRCLELLMLLICCYMAILVSTCSHY